MKRLFFLFAIIVFYSCKVAPLPTTYQVCNSTTPFATDIPYLDGSIYQVLVYHYSNAILIQQDSFVKISSKDGKSEIMNVPDRTEVLKVSFKMLPPESPLYNSPGNKRYYLADPVIVRREENNIIGINGSTYISDTLIKSNSSINLLK
jgi:hypothetical protein